jgi:hypothetical protein
LYLCDVRALLEQRSVPRNKHEQGTWLRAEGHASSKRDAEVVCRIEFMSPFMLTVVVWVFVVLLITGIMMLTVNIEVKQIVSCESNELFCVAQPLNGTKPTRKCDNSQKTQPDNQNTSMSDSMWHLWYEALSGVDPLSPIFRSDHSSITPKSPAQSTNSSIPARPDLKLPFPQSGWWDVLKVPLIFPLQVC